MLNLNKPLIKDIYSELLSIKKANYPEYTTEDKRDFGIMLLYIFAVFMKLYIDWTNRLFRNQFLPTAIDREYIYDNAIDRGYKPRGVLSQIVLLTFSTTLSVTIPKRFKVKNSNGVIFETLVAITSSTGGGNVSVLAIQGEYIAEGFIGTGLSSQVVICDSYPYVQGFVDITVNGEAYKNVSNLLAYSDMDKVCSYYAGINGELNILFGNDINGVIPQLNDEIKVMYYKGLGESGNVKAGELTEIVSSLAGVKSVTNSLVNSTTTTQDYLKSDVDIIVESTTGFMNSGFAYVGDKLFSYTSKTSTAFNNVNIDYDIPSDSQITVNGTSINRCYNIETNDQLKYKSLVDARTNDRIVSVEDFQSVVSKHPSVAWAKSYVLGNIVHIIAISIEGTGLDSDIKQEILDDLNFFKIPTIRCFIDNPTFRDVDIVIEIDKSINSTWNSDELILEDPVLYKGVKQNVDYAISQYLSPINSGSEIVSGIKRDLTSYEIYTLILGINGIKNVSIENLSFSEALNIINIGSNNTITSSIDIFSENNIGDYIIISNSFLGNDGYYRIISYVDAKNVNVSGSLLIEESVRFNFSVENDLIFTGNEIPRLGTLLIYEKNAGLSFSEATVNNFDSINDQLEERFR